MFHIPSHVVRDIQARLTRIEALMTTFGSDQAHLDSDVAALTAAFGSIIAELKLDAAALAAAAAAAGVTVPAIDFTAADALVASTQAEVAADVPSGAVPTGP